MKNLLAQKVTLLFLTGSLLSACDIVKDDVTPNELVSQGYTFVEKPAVINLSALGGGEEIDINGSVQPVYGELTTLTDTKGKKFLVYTPNESFKGQREDLKIDLVNKRDGNSFGRLRWDVGSLDNGGDECGSASGIYDYAKIAPGESITIDLLDNDIFCNVSYNGGAIGQYDIQNSEPIELFLGPGRRAELKYTAPEGFTGKVLLVYDLGINWKINNSDVVDYEEILADPYKYLEAFTTALVEIDVVEN
ncbi:MAG: hypothetical protein R2804_06615 [Cyclobacteriaceae bacterium]|jgi:hypothetical protein